MKNDIKIDFEKLVDVEIQGVQTWDYPDFSDAYVVNGAVEITKEEFDACSRETRHENEGRYFRDLTEAELDWINYEASDFVNQKAHEKIF